MPTASAVLARTGRVARHPAALAIGLLAGLAIGLAAPSTARALAPLGRAFADLLRLVAPVTLVTIVPVALAALPWTRLRGPVVVAARRALALAALGATTGGAVALLARLPAPPAAVAVPASPWRAVTRSLDDLTLVALALVAPLAWSLARAHDGTWRRTMQGAERAARRLVDAMLVVAPVGVAALMAGFAASAAGAAVRTVVALGAVVWGAQLAASAMAAGAAVAAGVSPLEVLRGGRDALITAFTTGSSAATLPIEWRCAERRLAVPPPIAALLLPAGSLVSKFGTTTFLAALAVAALRWSATSLTPATWLAAVAGALLLGAVTPPVSGGGLVMLGVLAAWTGADPGLAPVLVAIPFVGKLNTPLNVLGRLLVATSARGPLSPLPAPGARPTPAAPR